MVNGIKKIVSRVLPDNIKAIITPTYGKVVWKFRRLVLPTTLQIESVGGYEIAYRKGTTDQTALVYCSIDDPFFSRVPEYQLDEDHVIIDIGAYIGTFSLVAASKVKHGKVYAIEANQEAFNLLRINTALNNATNISLHHLAIGDRTGTCKLYYYKEYLGHSTVNVRSRHYEVVNSCTLADFMERNNITKCHFTKINCEGAEFPIVLNTPASVLRRFGVILVLYHCDLWPSNNETDLESHLQAADFNTRVIRETKKRGYIVAINRGG